jgi:hypothetical protein
VSPAKARMEVRRVNDEWRDALRVSRGLLIVLSMRSQNMCSLCKALTGDARHLPEGLRLAIRHATHYPNGQGDLDPGKFAATPLVLPSPFMSSEYEVICSVLTARTIHPTSVANPVPANVMLVLMTNTPPGRLLALTRRVVIKYNSAHLLYSNQFRWLCGRCGKAVVTNYVLFIPDTR